MVWQHGAAGGSGRSIKAVTMVLVPPTIIVAPGPSSGSSSLKGGSSGCTGAMLQATAERKRASPEGQALASEEGSMGTSGRQPGAVENKAIRAGGLGSASRGEPETTRHKTIR